MAHGAPPAFVVVGTMAQQDRHGLSAARPIFQWHARHEDLYVGQKNAGRVMLLATGDTAAYRGFFRLLTEQHIPFVVSENLGWMDEASSRYDLVIAPDRPPQELESYVRGGGRLLVAGTTPPPVPIGRLGERRTTQGYWRIHDRTALPSLQQTDLLFLDGPYLELAPVERPVLTLIPTAMFGPPEKVWGDKIETTVPGLIFTEHGKGRVAYVPWDVGGLYYRHSSESHAGLMSDLIDHLLPAGRQLRSDAHPLVEMTLMAQPARGRTLIHLVNGTGHHDTAYFPPVELRNIRIELAGPVRSARAVALDRVLPVTTSGAFRSFTLPSLRAYEVIVID
jgi:hypothetical protein